MEYVLPFLKDGYIKYSTANKGVQAVSAEYFKRNFRKIGAPAQHNTDSRAFYFQRIDEPNLVLRFIISEDNFSASLISYKEFTATHSFRQALSNEPSTNSFGIGYGSLSFSY